jgi:hypothetical protein
VAGFPGPPHIYETQKCQSCLDWDSNHRFWIHNLFFWENTHRWCHLQVVCSCLELNESTAFSTPTISFTQPFIYSILILLSKVHIPSLPNVHWGDLKTRLNGFQVPCAMEFSAVLTLLSFLKILSYNGVLTTQGVQDCSGSWDGMQNPLNQGKRSGVKSVFDNF